MKTSSHSLSTTTATAAAGEEGGVVPGLLPLLSEIPWKKRFRHKLVPLLEGNQQEAAAEWLRLHMPLLAYSHQKQQRAGWQKYAEQVQWALQAELQAELSQASQDSLRSRSRAEVFPALSAGMESAAVLVGLACQLEAGQDKKKRKSADQMAEFNRQLLLFLQEDEEVFVDEIPGPLLPLLGWRTLALATSFILQAENLSAEVFLQTWLRLIQRAGLLAELNQLVTEAAATSEPVITLIRGEVCCLCGLLFNEVLSHSRLFRTGRWLLIQELGALTDSDGTPHAQLVAVLPGWVASVVRQHQLAELTGEKFLNAQARRHWEWLLQRCSSLTAGNGQLLLTEVDTGAGNGNWPRILQAALLQLPRKSQTGWVFQTLQMLAAVTGESPALPRRQLSAEDQTAAIQTDWGHMACLRNNWYPGADLLAISHEVLQPRLDLSVLSTPLLSGIWEAELRINDQEVVGLEQEWLALCWYNEAAGDYLELRLETKEVTIDRQLFLSRTDHFIILADSVKCADAAANIKVSWELPLVSGWKVKEQAGTRDLLLKKQGLRVRLLPLGLPQDRVLKPDGFLQVDADKIRVQGQGQGNACLPLLLDWSPERQRKPCDWAALTITEERKVLPARAAFAARARIGRHQWLYLRNLEYSGLPRAVLGMHTDAESVIAEVTAAGQTERLVEVHYEDESEGSQP